MKITYVITPIYDFDTLQKQLFLKARVKITDITLEVREQDQSDEDWSKLIVLKIEEDEVAIPAISDIRVFVIFPGYGELKLTSEPSKMTAALFSQAIYRWDHSKATDGQEVLLLAVIKPKSGKVDFELLRNYSHIVQLFMQMMEKNAIRVHWVQDVQIGSMGGVIEVGVKPIPDTSAPKLPPPPDTPKE